MRARLAALSVLGAAMVALPLGLVLRYQHAELQALAARRAGLEPIARAVDVQRSLLVHRDVARALLLGQLALEPERRLRQGEVDERLTALAVTLVAGPWDRAVRESDALREDWSMLARRLSVPRGFSAEASDQAHRLLVEQTLQVVDLLDLALAPQASRSAALNMAWNSLRQRPRLAAHAPGKAPAETWQAELAGFDATMLAARQALDSTQADVEQRRRLLLAATAALAAAALLITRLLWRDAGLHTTSASNAVDAPHSTAPNRAPHSDRDETDRLISRLRGSEDPRPSKHGDLHLP